MSATDDLIGKLAGEAGAEPKRSPASFGRAFLLSTFFSLLVAIALSASGEGFRGNFAFYVSYEPFLLKVAGGLILACGAFLMARRAALPGSGGASWLLILPGILPFAYHATLDPWGPPAPDNLGAVRCSIDIALLSLPALWLSLRAMKKAAPTQPLRAGALAGLLAGAVGTAAHAFSCGNDGGLSVFLWYGLALFFMTGLGAAIGRKTLRW
jgi:hypothetical protein